MLGVLFWPGTGRCAATPGASRRRCTARTATCPRSSACSSSCPSRASRRAPSSATTPTARSAWQLPPSRRPPAAPPPPRRPRRPPVRAPSFSQHACASSYLMPASLEPLHLWPWMLAMYVPVAARPSAGQHGVLSKTLVRGAVAAQRGRQFRTVRQPRRRRRRLL